MYLPKPFHSLFSGALSGFAAAASFLLLRGRLGLWALLVAAVCLPVSWLLGSIIIDVADGVLRRITRDPLWVEQRQHQKKT